MDDWPTIVAGHRQLVWRTAWRLLGNHADASDCFQDAFLAALEVSRREPIRHWPALLVRLTTQRALDRLRQRMRRAVRCDDLPDPAAVASANPGPVAEAEAAELAARLRRALGKLPPRQAEVFCLRCVDGLSYSDIARELGLKTSAVGVLLHRARARLRELLAPAAPAKQPEVLQ
jgi:RNA polymerase sigma-70 factor (ECF subfamily)